MKNCPLHKIPVTMEMFGKFTMPTCPECKRKVAEKKAKEKEDK